MKCLIQLFFVLCTSALLANPAEKVEFINGSLPLAIQKAGQEGKLLLVEFGAQWCMPCRFMDENTFKDGEVISYISENYVPVKIDIDDFDGFVYKEKYKVEALPTFLIFDSSGKVIKRYEESMAPSNLLNILREHNQARHRKQVQTSLSAYEIEAKLYEAQKSRVNVSPYAQTAQDTQVDIVEQPVIVNTEVVEQSATIGEIVTSEPTNHGRFDNTPILEEVVQEDARLGQETVVTTSDEHLWIEEDEVYEMKAESPEYADQATSEVSTILESVTPKIIFYTVRVGNFANERSMNDYVKATSAIFLEDTHIFEQNHDSNTSFEVCLGAFASEASASSFINKLSLLNISGEIKTVEQ